jgi:hypothetical protein
MRSPVFLDVYALQRKRGDFLMSAIALNEVMCGRLPCQVNSYGRIKASAESGANTIN